MIEEKAHAYCTSIKDATIVINCLCGHTIVYKDSEFKFYKCICCEQVYAVLHQIKLMPLHKEYKPHPNCLVDIFGKNNINNE